MLKPEPMQRTLILSSMAYEGAIIETLHDLQAAHLIEFQETGSGAFAGFRAGAPLPTGAAASARLVRVRALLRHLGLEGEDAGRTFPVPEIESRLDRDLDAVEAEIARAVETREAVRNSLSEGRELEARLEPLATLPLRLEDYRGYDSLSAFVGRADATFEADVRAAAPDSLLVRGEGTLFALFVPRARSAAAQEALFRHGYTELEVPQGDGVPSERIAGIQAERATYQQRLAKAEADLARLAGLHRDFLLAAEEHLDIAVEKAEAPLAFASTDHAFVVDAWVPATSYERIEAALKRATHDHVYVSRRETAAPHPASSGHAPGHGIDAQSDAHDDHTPTGPQPPTKYDNPAGVNRFQWFTDLFSRPRYDEVDPTLIFAIAFPLFFGFMIGDLGLGLLMVALGMLLVRKLPRVDGMKQLGTAFVIAGVIAAAFGGVVFKDAMGIPLGVTAHMEHELEAEGVVLPICQDLYNHLHEPTWSCLLRGSDSSLHAEGWAEPLIYKVTDVNTMLLLSVFAAGVHLLLGLLIGLRNELGHGAKHVAAKLGFLILLVTFYPAVLALLGGPLGPLTTSQAYTVAGGGFVVGAIILGWAEGFTGVLEIPGILSAILSYLRLGAVAIAKGAMAVAFNALTLVAIGLGDGAGVGLFLLGLLAFLVVQALLFVLGILSAGIQALRLNFVEFFTKFYKGGGTPWKPFGRPRVITTSTSTP